MLQRFVKEVIESFGGLVEPVEYALCNVLIPEDYKSYFQNRTELVLAFDFEVAQENPDAEFVTFGSHVLDQVQAIVHEQAISTIRFAEIDRIELANPLKKMDDFYQNEHGKINILKEAKVLGAWAAFQFRLSLISDEKVEKTAQVWINLMTGALAERMQQLQLSIMYTDKPPYTLPTPKQIPIDKGFDKAFTYIKAQTQAELEQRQQDPQLQKDINRIQSYYEELIHENNRKAMRSNVTAKKKQEINTKSEAITIEMQKQLAEIKQKYHGHIDISLDHSIIYFIPMLAYQVEIDQRANKKHKTVYYNLITKEFE